MVKRRFQHGLTLLEVMVALAIFAITGSAILKAVGENLNSVGQLEAITVANWVANNQLTQLQLSRPWPIRNNVKGSSEMANRTWYWQRVVENTSDDELKQVTISVSLDSGFEDSITSVTTYFSKPVSTI
jgi:general secretion pathway protein I